MPLQQLVLNGFKSFADKTTIRFNNGITGIVGPNGSGKSNITEAIRWVMG
ncbi:AAA family ATPase, partial [Lactobacillus gasseri]